MLGCGGGSLLSCGSSSLLGRLLGSGRLGCGGHLLGGDRCLLDSSSVSRRFSAVCYGKNYNKKVNVEKSDYDKIFCTLLAKTL